MSSSVKTDVVIIGACIMGASCAFRLSEQGLKVAALEAQVSPAMGSTGRSTAGVRVQYTEEVNARISWKSIQEYQHFAHHALFRRPAKPGTQYYLNSFSTP